MRVSRRPRRDLPANLDELLATAEQALILVVLDELEAAVQYTDNEAWLKALKRLEQYWFAPLLAAIADGRFASLEIDACNGNSYLTTPRLQKHFWKRIRPLAWLCQ